MPETDFFACPPGHWRAGAVIVAHPDDETLWAGGTLLANPRWDWFVCSLCRASDPDRAPKYHRVLGHLKAHGSIADLDDGPEQTPLPDATVEAAILSLLPTMSFDVVLTHGPHGEYTRHLRHEEVCRAVARLWAAGRIATQWLFLFAYEDGGRRYLPRPHPEAHLRRSLPEEIWQRKLDLVTEVYSFAPESWEARTTPREEAFWAFDSPEALDAWLQQRGVKP